MWQGRGRGVAAGVWSPSGWETPATYPETARGVPKIFGGVGPPEWRGSPRNESTLAAYPETIRWGGARTSVGCPKLGGCGRKILTKSQLRPPSREACLYGAERVCVHFPYKNVFLKKCFRRTNIILRILSETTSGGYMRRKGEKASKCKGAESTRVTASLAALPPWVL